VIRPSVGDMMAGLVARIIVSPVSVGDMMAGPVARIIVSPV